MNNRDFRTVSPKQGNIKTMQMQPFSRESSRRHMEIQEGLLELSIKKESSSLLNKKSKSKKSEINLVNEFNAVVDADKVTEKEEDSLVVRRFEFSFLSYFVEVCLAYGLTIGICYLIQLGNFPYFQLLLIVGLINSISPWTPSNLILIVAGIIIICNNYLNVTILTYPAILICYFSVMIINEHNKFKIIFIVAIVVEIVWGFAVLPALFASIAINNKLAFYYIFPIFMLILRTMVVTFFWIIHYSEYVFLQIPFFMMGLWYGVILTLQTNSIEYWYLMVFFTLDIMNDRTQFLVGIVVSLLQSCKKNLRIRQKGDDEQQDDLSILPAHASGYNCIHSLHIVCLIYVFTRLPLYSSPYTSGTNLSAYIQLQWYIPLTTWALAVLYQLMCLVLERKRKDKLLYGFTNNGVLHTIFRGFMLILGFWFFYLGLGVGNYIFFPNNTRV